MAYIAMTNYQGQIFKDMTISAPCGAYVFDAETNNPILLLDEKTLFRTTGNNRLGIGRYRINMYNVNTGQKVYCNNYMMDDNEKKYHAVWSLEDEPYTPEMIYQKYGWKVGDDHRRVKKYKLTGRKRTLKFAKELRELGRHEEATRIIGEMEATVASGKRYIIHRKDVGLPPIV
jgi:hypothetical protein